jgi:tRNA(fMet)-specific endonuclease VapC
MRYLLDTNIIAEPTKPQPNQKVVADLAQYSGEVAISSVSWHELWFGVERLPPSRKRQNLQEYLQNLIAADLPILPYTTEAARWFAAERSRLVKSGLSPSYADGQIAAIAQVNNLILVTRNISDYIHLQGLIIENWFD